MQKVISKSREANKLTSQAKFTSVIITLIASIVVGSGIVSSAFADNPVDINYSVTVEPALNITTSANKVSLDLNPLNHDFDSQDLTVSVSTNNETGYKLYVNTEKTTNNPNGNKLIEKDDNSLYIETLDKEATNENDFTLNRWGYRIGSGNYLPFESGILLNSSKTQVENNASTLTFAAKVGYETKAGTYNLALNFQATANPKCNTTVEGPMQEFDPCPDLEDGTKGTLTDVRDSATYTVAKINGNWWMTQNLRYKGDIGSASNSMTIKSTTTNVEADMVLVYTDLTTAPYVDYDNAKIHNSGNITNGVWYNYAAASAGSIIGKTNADTQTYDVCPKNWHLPNEDNISDIGSYATLFGTNTGGRYDQNAIMNADTGFWWASECDYKSYNYAARYILMYDSSKGLRRSSLDKSNGLYVRCIRSN